MKLNTNSNTYTVLYASGVVIVVAFLLAFVSSALKEPSEANERIDQQKQILASLNLTPEKSEVESLYFFQPKKVLENKFPRPISNPIFIPTTAAQVLINPPFLGQGILVGHG